MLARGTVDRSFVTDGDHGGVLVFRTRVAPSSEPRVARPEDRLCG
jgi:hypothetical protein